MTPELKALVWAVLTALAIALAMKLVKMIGKWASDIRAALTALWDVHGQFSNNGGSTLRDAVDRIEKTSNETKDRLDKHIEWHISK